MFDLGKQRPLLGGELGPLADGDLGRGQISEVARLAQRGWLVQACDRAQQLLAFARKRVACGFELWWIECEGTSSHVC